MLNLAHELDEIPGNDDVLAHARTVARTRSQHWQQVTSGPHFAVCAAIVDREAETMAIITVDGVEEILVDHLAPFDRSASHAAARIAMEQTGLSLDIDRAQPIGVIAETCDVRPAESHLAIVVMWERSAAVRADLIETVRWVSLDELAAGEGEVATVARLAQAGLAERALKVSRTLR